MQYKNITFEIGNMFTGVMQVFCEFKGDIVYIGRESGQGVEWQCLTDSDANDFIERIERLNIEKWKCEYINSSIEDVDWHLDIEFLDGTVKRIYGRSSYPENWNDLLLIMGEYIPIIEDKRIESFTVRFYNKYEQSEYWSGQSVPVIIDIEEVINIDRTSGTFTISRKLLNDNDTSTHEKLEICRKLDVAELLDNIGYIDDNIETCDNVSVNNMITKYELEVTYYNHSKLNMQGDYNRLSLPKNWGSIIKVICNFMSRFGYYSILNTGYHGAVKDNEVVYVSVAFNDYSELTYYYQTDNLEIKIGDIVMVPVGNNNEENRAMVVDVEVYDKNDVPYPLDKTKKVIRVL